MGKRVIVHEEAQFSEDNQEKIKVLMEGGGAFVQFPEKVEVKFTTWPWCRILRKEHVRASRQRAKIFQVCFEC